MGRRVGGCRFGHRLNASQPRRRGGLLVQGIPHACYSEGAVREFL
jgi:hypothetical protein